MSLTLFTFDAVPSPLMMLPSPTPSPEIIDVFPKSALETVTTFSQTPVVGEFGVQASPSMVVGSPSPDMGTSPEMFVGSSPSFK